MASRDIGSVVALAHE